MQLSAAECIDPGHTGETVNFSCPVCGASDRLHAANALSKCDNCQHIFQTDLNVTASYDASYAHQYDHRPVKEMSELRWDFIQSHMNMPLGSRILDVGYGNGAFLKHARSVGMDIYGVDLHTEDFGVPVVTLETKLHFDLICFFDSLEHFPDLRPILNLRADNVIVSIPDTPSWLLSNPNAWRHYKPGEHLHYFSRRSLDLFMLAWGVGVKRAEGCPEDSLRGKLTVGEKNIDNIYTAIYTRG